MLYYHIKSSNHTKATIQNKSIGLFSSLFKITCEHKQYVGSSEGPDDGSLFNLSLRLFPVLLFWALELLFLCAGFFRSRWSLLCSALVTHFRLRLIAEVDGLFVVVLRFHKELVDVFVDNERELDISESNSLSESISTDVLSDEFDWWLIDSTRIAKDKISKRISWKFYCIFDRRFLISSIAVRWCLTSVDSIAFSYHQWISLGSMHWLTSFESLQAIAEMKNRWKKEDLPRKFQLTDCSCFSCSLVTSSWTRS